MIGKLEPQIHRAMYQRVRSNDGVPTARELFVEASGLLVLRGWTHESFTEAIEILERSAALDPDFALAPALLSLLRGFGARMGLESEVETVRAETTRWADQALRVDSMDSTVLGFAGCSLADVGYVERGQALLRNALDLNPSNAQAWVALGGVHMVRGEFDRAVEYLSRGIEISPVDSRLSVWGALLSVAQLMRGEVDEAIATARTACQRNDLTYLPRVALAGALLAQQDPDSALRALADARRIKPDLDGPQIESLIGRVLAKRLLALDATSQAD
jgi:tetratricopeptide (TPR) repeat protein